MVNKERLKECRQAMGLSQEELAARMGVTQQLIGAFEIGTKSPSIATLSVLADIFGCSTDYLLSRTDQK